MRLLPLLLLPLVAGCAGYAADYWKPKQSLIADELPRYGLSEERSACVTQSLTGSLTVWQLRQLGDLAGRLQAGGANPARLGEADLVYVAGLVKDPAVAEGVRAALAACPGAPTPEPARAAPPADPAAPAQPAPVPPGGEPGSARWLNLGTAASGQGMSVDAASIENGAGWRQAWFRLANPGEAGPGAISYLLRVDCTADTITPMAARKYSPEGEVLEENQHGPEWAVPLPVEAGTVMEIAHRALCT